MIGYSSYYIIQLEELDRLARDFNYTCTIDLTNRIIAIGPYNFNYQCYALEEGLASSKLSLMRKLIEESIVKKIQA